MTDWIESTVRALAFFGGVQLIVPDNPKAMIADDTGASYFTDL